MSALVAAEEYMFSESFRNWCRIQLTVEIKVLDFACRGGLPLVPLRFNRAATEHPYPCEKVGATRKVREMGVKPQGVASYTVVVHHGCTSY